MFCRPRLGAMGCVVPAAMILISLSGPAAARPDDLPPSSGFNVSANQQSDVKPMYSLAKAIRGEPPAGTKKASRSGLDRRLLRLLALIEGHFERPVIISSGCRSAGRNRRAGGARASLHLRCMAADIKLAGISEGTLLRYVSRLPGRGGVGTYCRNSIVHVDVGPRRSWYQGCGRSVHKFKFRGKYKHRAKRRLKRR